MTRGPSLGLEAQVYSVCICSPPKRADNAWLYICLNGVHCVLFTPGPAKDRLRPCISVSGDQSPRVHSSMEVTVELREGVRLEAYLHPPLLPCPRWGWKSQLLLLRRASTAMPGGGCSNKTHRTGGLNNRNAFLPSPGCLHGQVLVRALFLVETKRTALLIIPLCKGLNYSPLPSLRTVRLEGNSGWKKTG